MLRLYHTATYTDDAGGALEGMIPREQKSSGWAENAKVLKIVSGPPLPHESARELRPLQALPESLWDFCGIRAPAAMIRLRGAGKKSE